MREGRAGFRVVVLPGHGARAGGSDGRLACGTNVRHHAHHYNAHFRPGQRQPALPGARSCLLLPGLTGLPGHSALPCLSELAGLSGLPTPLRPDCTL